MRKASLVLLLLAIAAALWLLLSRPGPAEQTPTSPDHQAPDGEAPSLRSAPSLTSNATPPRDDSEALSTPQSPTTEGAAVKAWLEVRVRCEDPEFQDAVRVYALRDASRGAEDASDLPGASAKLNGEAVRFGLLEPGRYAVGAVADWGFAVNEAVEVVAGETRAVEVVLDKPGVVQVRLNSGWPLDWHPNVRGQVFLKPQGGHRPYGEAPAQGDTYRVVRVCSLWTDLQGVAVPRGVRYDASLRLVVPVLGAANAVVEVAPEAAGLHLEPARVTAGDRIQLSIPTLEGVSLALRPATPWPEGFATTLKVEVHGPGWVSRHVWYREMNATTMANAHNALIAPLALAEGPLHVRWSGSGIRPGALTDVRGQISEGEALRVALEVDPARAGTPLRVDVGQSPPAKWTHLTAWGGDPTARLRHRTATKATSLLLTSPWRTQQRLLAHTDDGRLSAVTPMPTQGPVSLRWMQGGYLQFSGVSAYPDDAGPLTIRRTDGVPILSEKRASRVHYLSKDDRLGPFAPGPVTLELRAGLRVLGTYQVVIRAGEDRRLRIP